VAVVRKKLIEIAEVLGGYQHRGTPSDIGNESDGSHVIIQVRDLDLGGRFRDEVLSSNGVVPYVWYDGLYHVTPAADPGRYRVLPGDVLFLARGQRLIAVPVTAPPENAIAAYHFYIVRPYGDRLQPEYLAWYINQPPARAYLGERLHGSHMKMVPKSAFEELVIEIPPLQVQKAVVELEQLRQREEYLLGRLVRTRGKMLTGLCLGLVRGNTDHHLTGDTAHG
jgi:hypothetical protein